MWTLPVTEQTRSSRWPWAWSQSLHFQTGFHCQLFTPPHQVKKNTLSLTWIRGEPPSSGRDPLRFSFLSGGWPLSGDQVHSQSLHCGPLQVDVITASSRSLLISPGSILSKLNCGGTTCPREPALQSLPVQAEQPAGSNTTQHARCRTSALGHVCFPPALTELSALWMQLCPAHSLTRASVV